MREKIQSMLLDNVKLREERDSAISQVQSIIHVQAMKVKNSSQVNSANNRSHDDTLDLQQFAQSKKDLPGVYNNSSSSRQS